MRRPPWSWIRSSSCVGARDRRLEVLVVERDPEVVDPGELPLAGLHDDVHAAPLELREAELEATLVELLPRDARLERREVVAEPAVTGDEVEAELADVARLDLPDLSS